MFTGIGEEKDQYVILSAQKEKKIFATGYYNEKQHMMIVFYILLAKRLI